MSAGARSRTDPRRESELYQTPDITACEGCPGRSVFMESENTDGWIASDHVVDVTQ
ncbi:hypothetical protein [Halorubrum lacusprofundi]|jgi:hypothetical protein|uniref:Uncharacterized protein n=1 Tax=Halorubrum lacusprofundi (strain ATCC 49239 / DSM 5036 / JCM 8891 / ACAM 34) TaxID=416348 RepID=B9LTK2_HALLT|nr:hypothetical protein [Halorubrum lacusprofundi]ACM56136.1 hypothetical protein Hlac_0534 [Halorubrum lacusprofundi ATCC 49239]MCG1005553.1 hypothetical protein [Halorubrum lacusprofundi]